MTLQREVPRMTPYSGVLYWTARVSFYITSGPSLIARLEMCGQQATSRCTALDVTVVSIPRSHAIKSSRSNRINPKKMTIPITESLSRLVISISYYTWHYWNTYTSYFLYSIVSVIRFSGESRSQRECPTTLVWTSWIHWHLYRGAMTCTQVSLFSFDALRECGHWAPKCADSISRCLVN